MKKMCCLAALLVFMGCSLTKERSDAETKTGAPRTGHPPPEKPAEEKVGVKPTPDPTYDPVEPDPVVPDRPLPDPEKPAGQPEDLERTVEDPHVAAPQGLDDFITSMCGVRLSHGSSGKNLDLEIRTGEHTTQLHSPPAPGVSEFARLIVISVSQKAIFVNEYKVADIDCSLEKGGECPDSFDDTHAKRIYKVRPEEGEAGGPGDLVIVALLKQLTYFQRGRSALLKVLSGEASSWVSECDVVTLAVDRDVPYGIIARVLHTAAVADLTRARFLVLDENDSLTYIPLLSPRLSPAQAKDFHVVGDDWWQSGEPAGFETAYLSYSAARVSEDFLGFPDPMLPVCLPAGVAWDRIMDDTGYAREAAGQVTDHADAVVDSFGPLLGLSANPDSAEDEVEEPSQPAAKPDSQPIPEELAVVDEATPGGVAENTEVAEDGVAALPVGSDEDSPATSPEAVVPPSETLPYVYVTNDSYIIVLKSADGLVVEATELQKVERVKLYTYLARSAGNLVNLGAVADLRAEHFVAALDSVRYRCGVHSMSGRCHHWKPVRPTVYLFSTPAGRFGPIPDEVAHDAPELPALEKATEPAGSENPKEASAGEPDAVAPDKGQEEPEGEAPPTPAADSK